MAPAPKRLRVKSTAKSPVATKSPTSSRVELDLETRLAEALEQQVATNNVLRALGGSRTNAQPVFEAVATAVLHRCGADSSSVYTFDGELIHLAALANARPSDTRLQRQLWPRPPSRDNAITQAILTRSVVAIADLVERTDHLVRSRSHAGLRSILALPLLREGNAIGAIAMSRDGPQPFHQMQIALLQGFAEQIVFAMEYVRLFRELADQNRDVADALEQQSATNEILDVMSESHRDVQPVFDAIATVALKLCRASSASAYTFDGDSIHLAAAVQVNAGSLASMRRIYPRPPSRDTEVTRAILMRRVIAIPDVLEDPDYLAEAQALTDGCRSVLAFPLTWLGKPVGAIAVGRAQPGPFTNPQIAMLQTFADRTVIAIENVRLFRELEARTAQLTQSVGELRALGDIGQAVNSTLDLETVLSTIVSRATELANMDGGSIYEYDEAREVFHLHTAYRLPDALVAALRSTPISKGEGALGLMALTGEAMQIADIMDEGSYQSRVRELLLQLGYRGLLAIPLMRDGHLLGGLVVNRSTPGQFGAPTIALLKAFATQSALAIQNARLFREIEDKSQQLETASRHKSEFLANMSHELRTPLNAIIGFSEVLSERLFGEINDKQAEYITDILGAGRHLLSLINDILDLSKIEAGRMELDLGDFDLRAAVSHCVGLVRERAQRHGIALACNVDRCPAEVRADERKVKQVLLNLLSNALKFTPASGRIDVKGIAKDGMAEISVTDTGAGIAPKDQSAVFEEFRQVGAADKKVEGTGLGLAISRKFVELHGGSISLVSALDKGSTFTFTLPLH
jgi:two-component system, NtrC family, sensor kinase